MIHSPIDHKWPQRTFISYLTTRFMRHLLIFFSSGAVCFPPPPTPRVIVCCFLTLGGTMYRRVIVGRVQLVLSDFWTLFVYITLFKSQSRDEIHGNLFSVSRNEPSVPSQGVKHSTTCECHSQELNFVVFLPTSTTKARTIFFVLSLSLSGPCEHVLWSVQDQKTSKRISLRYHDREMRSRPFTLS